MINNGTVDANWLYFVLKQVLKLHRRIDARIWAETGIGVRVRHRDKRRTDLFECQFASVPGLVKRL